MSACSPSTSGGTQAWLHQVPAQQQDPKRQCRPCTRQLDPASAAIPHAAVHHLWRRLRGPLQFTPQNTPLDRAPLASFCWGYSNPPVALRVNASSAGTIRRCPPSAAQQALTCTQHGMGGVPRWAGPSSASAASGARLSRRAGALERSAGSPGPPALTHWPMQSKAVDLSLVPQCSVVRAAPEDIPVASGQHNASCVRRICPSIAALLLIAGWQG